MYRKTEYRLVHSLLYFAFLMALVLVSTAKFVSEGDSNEILISGTDRRLETEDTRATTIFPKRYLKIALLVEYNIYDKHFAKDMQKTLKQVQDLFHHVSLDLKELNVIVSLAGVVVWTQPNLFDIPEKLHANYHQLLSYNKQFKSMFNHDFLMFLGSKQFGASATSGILGLSGLYKMCTTLSLAWKIIDAPKTANGLISWAGTSHEIGHQLGFSHRDKKCNCGEPLSLEPTRLDKEGDMVSHCRMGWSKYMKGEPPVWGSCSREFFGSLTTSNYTCLNNNPRTFRIRGEFGGKRVLDISKGSTSAGAIVVLQDAKDTVSQQWYVGGDLTIRSMLNDFCLTSNGPDKQVTMEPCGIRRDNKWAYNYWTRRIEITNITESRCLDIRDSKDAPGISLTENQCGKSPNQKWKLEGEDGQEKGSNILYTRYTGPYLLFTFRNKKDAQLVLEVSSTSTATGRADVIINRSNQSAITQKWYIATDKTIRSAFNNNCLVSNDPGKVTVEICDSRKDNKWIYNNYRLEIRIGSSAKTTLRCLDTRCKKNASRGPVLEECQCDGKGRKWIKESEFNNCTSLDTTCRSGFLKDAVFDVIQVPK